MRERQRGDKRFDFLLPWSPYNAYYLKRLHEVEKSLREEDTSNGRDDSAAVEETSKDGEVVKAADVEPKAEPPKAEPEPDSAPAIVEEPKDIAPVRVSITSFGGDESDKEDDTRADIGEIFSKEQTSESDTAAEVGSTAQAVELTEEQKKRAARLERAKILAEKIQQVTMIAETCPLKFARICLLKIRHLMSSFVCQEDGSLSKGGEAASKLIAPKTSRNVEQHSSSDER